MKCPNCGREMNTESRHIVYVGYQCDFCNISYNGYLLNNQWSVPCEYAPTEKQKNTLLFINNRLGTDFKPITKNQCWKVINENFDKAKKSPKRRRYNTKHSYSKTYTYTDEDCDIFGLDASMFY